MKWLRKVLLVFSVIGVVASGTGLAIVTFGAEHVESASNEFIIAGIEKRVRKLLTLEPAEGEGRIADLRNKLSDKSELLADKILGGDFPVRLREQVGEACVCKLTHAERAEVIRGYGEAKAAVAKMIEALRAGKFSETHMEKGTMRRLLAGYHVSTVEGLTRELQIFLGTNLVLFAVIGLAAYFSAATAELLFPLGILLLGTLTSAGFYIFNQDWLATILLNDWTGYGYLAWVAVVSLFLADILLNRARVTANILSAISPSNVSPC
ncbi:MAG: hypothetical protein OEY85_15335 [Rhodospirillales bacterium]|nr:hypothetical protein [Rhodospirillales bacterium]